MIKINYKSYIGFFITACFLTFFTISPSFANLAVPINGKVKSYTDGTYTIETSKSLVHIKDKKLSLELKRTLHRRIGRSVQITVPHYAISSYKPLKSNRNPATDGGTTNQESKGCSK